MRSMSVLLSIFVCAFTAGAAEAAISDADATKLMAKYNCQACHAVDKKLVGPAFRDVARKYAGDSAAPDTLEGKVKNGSVGTWGPIPMPPNAAPSPDVAGLVQWVLALK